MLVESTQELRIFVSFSECSRLSLLFGGTQLRYLSMCLDNLFRQARPFRASRRLTLKVKSLMHESIARPARAVEIPQNSVVGCTPAHSCLVTTQLR